MQNFRQALFLILLSFLGYHVGLCHLHADSNGKYIDVVPEKAAEKYDKEKYEITIKQYRKLKKDHEERETAARKNDPAYGRAKEWYENEKAGVIGQYKHQEKEFLKNLSEEQHTKYNQWKNKYTSILNEKNFETEWHDYLDSHKAILYFVERALQSMKTGISGNTIELPEGNDDVKFLWLQDYSSKVQDGPQKNIDLAALEEELGITIELKSGIENDEKESFRHNVYTTYLFSHTPENLTELGKELKKLRSQLDTIRPGWQYAEGLWPDRNVLLRNKGHSSYSWVNITLCVIGLVMLLAGLIGHIYKYFKRGRNET
jgi:hypothetical protein